MNFGSAMTVMGPLAVSEFTSKERQDGRYTHRLQVVIYMDNGRTGDDRVSQKITGFAGITTDTSEVPSWLQLMAKEMYKGRVVRINISNLSTSNYNKDGKQFMNVNFNFRSDDVSTFGPGADRAGSPQGVSEDSVPPQTADEGMETAPF